MMYGQTKEGAKVLKELVIELHVVIAIQTERLAKKGSRDSWQSLK